MGRMDQQVPLTLKLILKATITGWTVIEQLSETLAGFQPERFTQIIQRGSQKVAGADRRLK